MLAQYIPQGSLEDLSQSRLPGKKSRVVMFNYREKRSLSQCSPPVLTATGLGSIAQGVNGVNGSNSHHVKEKKIDASRVAQGDGEMSIALIKRQRKLFRSGQMKKAYLTKVPELDSTGRIVTSLVQFIKDCALETELVNLLCRLEPQIFRRPGDPLPNHHLNNTREVFALQRLVLEMAPSRQLSSSSHLSPIIARPPTLIAKSFTEDADSEAFWSASENDFTFFNDNEECGLPAAETASNVSFSSLSEKIMMSAGNSSLGGLPTLQPPKPQESQVDVVQELTEFRKERKAAFENATKRGIKFVDGYWPGEVKVIRDPSREGYMDYYGNYFDKGSYR